MPSATMFFLTVASFGAWCNAPWRNEDDSEKTDYTDEEWKRILHEATICTDATRTPTITECRNVGYIKLSKGTYSPDTKGYQFVDACEKLGLTFTVKEVMDLSMMLFDVRKGTRTIDECVKTAMEKLNLISAIFAVNGYQCVVMAPTKILATQHYEDFKKLLTPVGIEVELLVEGQKAAERKKTIARIKDGSVKIIIGTSSVLSEKVEYKDLALLITDEEHRFGVAQREALMEKAKDGIHCISMSATPIPRSLALAINGNSTRIIDVKTMPSGRKPVQTILFGNEEKTYEAMYRQIAEGHQCYIVCPLVDKSDSESMENVESVDETYQKATDYFQTHHPSVKIAAITGKTKKVEQQEILNAYVAGDIHILIATTIVEVGVNVPNATVMVIKNAERFGLAQLHQLRGRVGRSSTQSYCVLLSKDKENPRLLTMVRTTDGFEIAKADLEQRGAGDLIGVEQSGFNKVLTCMTQHKELYNAILSEIGKTI